MAHDEPQQRPAQLLEKIIDRLNHRLDEKANELRRAEDRETYQLAVNDTLQDQVAQLTHVIDQVAAENRILRDRIGLPEGEAVELTDAEAADAEAAGAAVIEQD
jgi:uncharacterized coiled-coil protein SlyX